MKPVSSTGDRADHRAARSHLGLGGAVGGHHVPQGEDQRPQAIPADRRDLQHGPAELLGDLIADEFGEFAGVGNVDLVEHHSARPVGEIPECRVTLQGRLIGGQLGFQGLDIGDRVAAGFHGGAVDDMDQHRAPFQVTQEIQAETAAGGGAGDQAGHIGDGEGVVTGGHHAQIGHQGGERVVGDLGFGRRDGGDQRGLARRRETDQADIGDGLEFQGQIAGLALLAEQGETGGLAGP